MIGVLTTLASMATQQFGIPLGVLAICVTTILAGFGVLGRGGIITVVFCVLVYFSAPWIVQQLNTGAA